MFILLFLLCGLPLNFSLHLVGEWESSDFFHFLGKFGFQQTETNNIINSQGYIYGNISSKLNLTSIFTLIVVDSELFLDFFINRNTFPPTTACNKMFEEINKLAWDRKCNSDAKQDYIRYIPCSKNDLCYEEDEPAWVIPGSQFTYRVEDTKSPRFWYLSMVACTRNYQLNYFKMKNSTFNYSFSICNWTHQDQIYDTIKYDIWVVNGIPNSKQISLFSHQFSFEMHSIFEVYLVFFLLYLLLLPLQIYALYVQKHILPVLLLTCIMLEFIGITFNLIHFVKFANDGIGIENLKIVGDFIDTLSQCFFMLLLLIIVMGWIICYKKLPKFSWIVLLTLWSSYTLATIVLFCWNQIEIDFVSEIDEWQTMPGKIILVFRLLIMFWFLYELRITFINCLNSYMQTIYLHFGAGYLVWFIYLPLSVVICSWVPVFWRYKTMISIMYSADFLSFCVMMHLLWTSRSYLYFNHTHLQKINLNFYGFDEYLAKNAPTNANFNLLHKAG